MRRAGIIGLVCALAAFGGAFGAACGDEGEAATGTGTGANRSKKGLELRTEDGYEVVLADNRSLDALRGSKNKASEAARQRAAARRRENLVMTPTSPDPENGDFTLEEAVAGLPVDGTLVAEIRTELGTLMCDLYADRVPKTVANFVGLARGKRPWWDARSGTWQSNRAAYDGTSFHRVVPDYLIQGGDYLDDGTGRVGYSLPHEQPETGPILHDRAGLLCMASHGPNENGAQFFITDGAAPQLDQADRQFTVLGRCQPDDLIHRIARVPQSGGEENRPLTPVTIIRVLIRRVVGGAEAARPTQPQLPPDSPETPRGASPGPGDLYRAPIPPNPQPPAPPPRDPPSIR